MVGADNTTELWRLPAYNIPTYPPIRRNLGRQGFQLYFYNKTHQY